MVSELTVLPLLQMDYRDLALAIYVDFSNISNYRNIDMFTESFRLSEEQ